MVLEGKKALVTGARRSIGRGIALALAEAGCDLGINDIERDADGEATLRLVRDKGRAAEFYRADISDAAQVDGMVRSFVERFGRIDILVNNPYATRHVPFLEITEELWDRTIRVCLKGYFLTSQRVATEMARQGDGGAIVSISSVHAERVWRNDASYGVAKAGVNRLTMSMAVDLGPHGIRCNTIMPGYVDTDHLYGAGFPARQTLSERYRAFIPGGRFATPEDVGRAVVFLASPAAGNITGISLSVDGGFLTTGVP